MLVKYGDCKINSIIEEEDLEEDQKDMVAKNAKQIQQSKNTKINQISSENKKSN